MPTTAKTTTKTVKTAGKKTDPPKYDPQAGFHPRRVDAGGSPEELHGKHWKKV
jgi:hypothetical protein